MKILWFTNSLSNYQSDNTGYNGCGWISSMELELTSISEIELAISFPMKNQPNKIRHGNVVYYPVGNDTTHNRIIEKFNLLFNPSKFENSKRAILINQYLKIIEDFNPDIIHVFGSEFYFGLVSEYTTVPVVLHIQGLINPCLNAYLPPFVSWNNFLYSSKNIITIQRRIIERNVFQMAAIREREILCNINFFIGRTEWDKRMVDVFNPNSVYYYGGEILREIFYTNKKRCINKKLSIVSTTSNPPYKGYDLILKTAYVLKYILKINFNWIVFGNINPDFIEKKFGMNHHLLNIELKGIVDANAIKEAILQATCYFNSSYIENSSNSVCEAQILGCPVISTNVGGINSLIEDGVDGFLVPSNDPYQSAYLIKKLYMDNNLNYMIGKKAMVTAKERHDKKNIVNELLSIYKDIINWKRN